MTKKKTGLLAEIWKYRVAYAYIAPFYLLFATFTLFPMAAGFALSFFRWDGMSAMHFIKLDNYINLLGDPLFWKALKNTLFMGLIAHIPILICFLCASKFFMDGLTAGAVKE